MLLSFRNKSPKKKEEEEKKLERQREKVWCSYFYGLLLYGFTLPFLNLVKNFDHSFNFFTAFSLMEDREIWGGMGIDS